MNLCRLLVVSLVLIIQHAAVVVVAVDRAVVTLGDSYSSGCGIHNRDDEYDTQYGGSVSVNGQTYKLTARGDTECWRDLSLTPGPRYQRANSATYPNSFFYACKGAEISHVENQLDLLNVQHPNEANAQWQDSIFLFTAGGNDIRTKLPEDWPSLLERCILWQSSCEKKNDNQVDNWSTIAADLNDLFLKIAVRAANAHAIRVMGYPRVMQRKSNWIYCPDVTGIDRKEADWIDDQVEYLNGLIVNAVSYATDTSNFNPAFMAAFPGETVPAVPDMQYVEVYSYLTIGACTGTPNTRHVNDKVLVNVVQTSDASFHPSEVGYDRYYDAFCNSL